MQKMRNYFRFKNIIKWKKLLYYVIGIILLVFIIGLIPALRDLILKPVWPRSWIQVSTLQVLKVMFMTKLPSNVTDLVCHKKKPDFNEQKLLDMADCQAGQRSKFSKVSHLSRELPFQPTINEIDRCSLISLYLEMSAILNTAKLSYFLVFGTLLGVYRHEGIIPWDDDIDIAANGLEWESFRSTLSCVEGYKLFINSNMHWKFSRTNSSYPFIDIFFYTEDETYIWGLTSYVFNDFVYKKSDVFPLVTGKFEGVPVLLPKEMKTIVHNFANPAYCTSPSLIHKSHTSLPVKTVLCSTLNDVYTMHNLDEN